MINLPNLVPNHIAVLDKTTTRLPLYVSINYMIDIEDYFHNSAAKVIYENRDTLENCKVLDCPTEPLMLVSYKELQRLLPTDDPIFDLIKERMGTGHECGFSGIMSINTCPFTYKGSGECVGREYLNIFIQESNSEEINRIYKMKKEDPQSAIDYIMSV